MALRAENRIVALLAAGKQLGSGLAGLADLQLGSEAMGNCRQRILDRFWAESKGLSSENALVCLTNKEATVAGPGESGDSDEYTKGLLATVGARSPLSLTGALSLTLPFSSLL